MRIRIRFLALTRVGPFRSKFPKVREVTSSAATFRGALLRERRIDKNKRTCNPVNSDSLTILLNLHAFLGKIGNTEWLDIEPLELVPKLRIWG